MEAKQGFGTTSELVALWVVSISCHGDNNLRIRCIVGHATGLRLWLVLVSGADATHKWQCELCSQLCQCCCLQCKGTH